ncbi:hypothetical protein ACFZAR_36185 [Streptomyces sp. NPDC008222]|uniref:hypothetical protein n=1 Tax=Streptomyces sp. NPDC008222 TaxID=3364820 RepID=UPI0036F13852
MTQQPLDLDQIEARAAHLYEYGDPTDSRVSGWEMLAGTDVPALVSHIRQQNTVIAELRATLEAGRAAH